MRYAAGSHRLYPGVYSLAAPELLAENAQLVAALLAAGDGAALGLGTAAWRWELIPAPPVRIELTVPRPRAVAGVLLFELARPRPGDVTWNGRLRSTSVARTLLDLAIRYDTRALLRAMAEAEFHHDLRPADILGTLRRGHPGSAKLRAALDAHVPGRGKARSDLERGFRRLLIKHGLELPLRNEPVGRWEADCVWPAHRVIVELDGGQHDRPHQATTDRDRDLWLRRRGYVVRRYGDEQLSHEPAAVIADLHDAFAQAAAAGYATRRS